MAHFKFELARIAILQPYLLENAYDSTGNITMLRRYNGDGTSLIIRLQLLFGNKQIKKSNRQH